MACCQKYIDFPYSSAKGRRLNGILSVSMVASRLTLITMKQSLLNIWTVFNPTYLLSFLLVSALVASFMSTAVENNLENSIIGKTCDLHTIMKEFVMYSHPPVVMLLHSLVNVMVHHGCRPNNFGNIVRVPAV